MIKKISAKELNDLKAKSKDLVIIDVRTEPEVARGKIPDSIHLELNRLEEEVEKLLTNKDNPVVVYCLSGSRSLDASETLERLGFRNIFDLENGMLGWRTQGLPTN
jgi:rhodanese-related sulfurtransferase